MPSSNPWSNVSASCRPEPAAQDRFDWRPSPTLIAAVLLVGLLAALGCLASDLPLPSARALAAVALAHAAVAAWHEWRRPRLQVVVTAAGGIRIDGQRVGDMTVDWRGALGFMSWGGDGRRRQRRIWLPDTLPAPRRRELRLALMRVRTDPDPESVAR